jgi:phasin
MADNTTRGYDVPVEMREFAEKSVDQARKAVDGFMGAAQRTVSTFGGDANPVHSGATEATRKTFAIAEQNISAAFDLAERIVRAKDIQEVVQLQSEYMRSQFEAMQSQMREFSSFAKSAPEAAKPATPPKK